MKRIIAALLSMCILGTAAPLIVKSDTNGSVTANAEDPTRMCGDDLTWAIEGNTLIISGTGDMYDYEPYTSPFCENVYIHDIVIEEGVTNIGTGAFEYCENLTSVSIPESVEAINDWAFQYCEKLTSIEIPDSVKSIGGYAFSGCKSLTQITLPEGLASIEEGLFCGCESLTSVKLPEGAESIGEYAFMMCKSLTSLTIPDSVVSIGDCAFMLCMRLKSITIPDKVEKISESMFENCTSLTEVIIPESVTSIEDWAFASCYDLVTVTVPSSVSSIGFAAFQNCKKLEKIVILADDCEIYANNETICNDDEGYAGTIEGHAGSTAQTYAKMFGYTFVTVSELPDTDVTYGDANGNGTIEMADAVLILQSQASPDKYGVDGTEEDHITAQGMINADCSGSGDGVTAKDALAVQKYLLKMIILPEE